MHTRALLVAIFLPVLLLLGVALTLDLPVGGKTEVEGRNTRAAVAVRDPVHPLEEMGTWAFCMPLLKRSYEKVYAFTETDRKNRQPVLEQFQSGLVEALQRFDTVDLYLMAHTNSYHGWVEEIEPELRAKIRLVYNSGCWCARQNDIWLKLGARCYVAHPEAASHAAFFVYFLRRLTAGYSVERAVSEANHNADQFFARLAALVPSTSRDRNAWHHSRGQVFGEGNFKIGALGS